MTGRSLSAQVDYWNLRGTDLPYEEGSSRDQRVLNSRKFPALSLSLTVERDSADIRALDYFGGAQNNYSSDYTVVKALCTLYAQRSVQGISL